MKIFYKPFGIVAGIVGARLGSKAFQSVWGRFDTLAPPEPTAGDAPLPQVVAAAALEAATMAAIGAVVDRAAATTFHYLFGAWPGKNRVKKTAEQD
ncbi:MAG TPA: DUF4235 domain-containing protein [Solirubrobacteraceae bacterium]|jgi:hypothetical protein|nr:DUF4235 domain-containing protein [Solirubrobacteraceae bacterium]